MSAREWVRSVSTRCASSCVFCVRLRSISVRNEACHAPPIITSKVTADTRMRTTKAASSLKKIRFFTLSSSSFWNLEAITGPANGFEIAGIFWIGLDLLADAANVDIDRARSDIRRVAPNGVEQVVAAEDTSCMTGEIIEQAEFGGRSGDGSAAHGKDHRRGIDFDFADLHGAGRQRAFKAAEHRFDASHKLTRTKRLGDVVVGADFEAKNAIGFAAFCGEKNYGD